MRVSWLEGYPVHIESRQKKKDDSCLPEYDCFGRCSRFDQAVFNENRVSLGLYRVVIRCNGGQAQGVGFERDSRR